MTSCEHLDWLRKGVRLTMRNIWKTPDQRDSDVSERLQVETEATPRARLDSILLIGAAEQQSVPLKNAGQALLVLLNKRRLNLPPPHGAVPRLVLMWLNCTVPDDPTSTRIKKRSCFPLASPGEGHVGATQQMGVIQL